MSFTSVLTLSAAKEYLRIDDGQNEDDAGITAMINAAFSYLEKHTNHIFTVREKTYPLSGNDCIRVYDYPINSVVKALDKAGADITLTFETNYDRTDKTMHTLFESIDIDAASLVLNVGYADPANIPDDLIEAAKMIVGALYYNKEAERIEDVLPLSVKMMVDANRRFLI